MGALSIIPMQAANPSSSKDNITGTMPKPRAAGSKMLCGPPQRWDARKGSSSLGCSSVVESAYLSTTSLGGQTASQMQPLSTTQRTCAGPKPCVLLASPLHPNAPLLQTTAESALLWGEGYNRGCCPKRGLHPAAMSE